MGDPLGALTPRSLWQHFASIAAIPRPSKHEERIVAWVRDLAARHDFRVKSDPVGNLVIDVPATTGHEVESLYSVVSPLALPPLLPVERLCLFAATADRFLSRDQVVRLWQHWSQPRLEWVPGGHITALFSGGSRNVVREFFATD